MAAAKSPNTTGSSQAQRMYWIAVRVPGSMMGLMRSAITFLVFQRPGALTVKFRSKKKRASGQKPQQPSSSTGNNHRSDWRV